MRIFVPILPKFRTNVNELPDLVTSVGVCSAPPQRFPDNLEREQQWQYRHQHDAHHQLQRQADLDVVDKCVAACGHNQRVRRRRERRSETQANRGRYSKQERVRADTDLYRGTQRDRREQHDRSRIADDHFRIQFATTSPSIFESAASRPAPFGRLECSSLRKHPLSLLQIIPHHRGYFLRLFIFRRILKRFPE